MSVTFAENSCCSQIRFSALSTKALPLTQLAANQNVRITITDFL